MPSLRVKSFFTATAVAFVSLILMLLLTWQYVRDHEAAHQQNAQSLVHGELMALRSSIEAALYRRLNLPMALKSFVVSNPNFTPAEFDAFAEDLSVSVPGILSLQLAPNAIVTLITNKERNKKAIGHDLLSDPMRRPAVIKSIEESRFIVAGPIKLIQGGEAIIARLPIFIEGYDGPLEWDNFWGFATVLIETDWLFKSAGLGEVNKKTDVAIRGVNGMGSDGDIFFGEPEIFANPTSLASVSLPNGSWQIAGRIDPRSSDHAHPVFIVSVTTVIIFSVAMIWLLVYRQGSRELLLAKIEAERASDMKSKFLATVSHEIRTPLNAIIGLSEILSEKDLPTDVLGDVNEIQNSGEALLEILNQVLDYSSIEYGEYKIEKRGFQVDSLINNTLDVLKAQATQKRIELHYLPDLSIKDRWILSDPTRLRQILLNLVGNAIKFTEYGFVTINASYSSAGDKMLRIDVRDTGKGISSEGMQKLFQPFSQVDSSITRKFGGTGLGLSICKRIAEKLGGKIGAESVVGSGSSFWIEIPVEPFEPQKTENNQADLIPSLPHFRILLVEDNETNRNVAIAMLERLGQAVDFACNGKEAVNMAEEQRYDLIFMDMQMPIMSGIDAAHVIRSSKGPNRTIPIFAMTANASPDDRKACFEAGMNGFESKPVRKKRLAEILATLPNASLDALQSSSTDFQQSPPVGRDVVNQHGHYDRKEELIDQLGEDGYYDLWEAFREEAQSLYGLIQESLAAGSSEAARSHLHTLKGAAANIGLDELATHAEAMRAADAPKSMLGKLDDIAERENIFEQTG